MIKWTICFIKQGNRILLLNREKNPGMGRWNGVGGKIERGESPRESVIREVQEETGIILNELKYKGLVTWDKTGEKQGMHCFIAEHDGNEEYRTPALVDEGILSWKEMEWIFDPMNKGVMPHLQKFLPIMLSDLKNYEHFCTFENSILIDHKVIEVKFNVD